MRRIPQATTPPIMLKVYLSSDHVSAATGKTVAVTISKNGGAFANPSAGATNATEVANGWYTFTPSATDTGTTGDLVVRGTATACDDAERLCDVVNANNGGMASLPNTACTTNGSLITSGASADQLLVSGNGKISVANNGITSSSIAGNSFIGTMFATSFYDSLLANHSGTATAATSTTITLQNTASGVDNYYVGQQIRIRANAGAQQVRTITGYVGSTFVATIDRAWATTPDNTSTYAVIGDDAPAVNSSLQVVASSATLAASQHVIVDSGTVTNLTNAPGAGDFTAAMKTSLNAATPSTTVSDKTGFALSAAGLDQIAVTDPGAPASQTTFPKKLMGMWRSIFGKQTLTATQLKNYAADGTTVNSTQAVSDDGTTQTKGEAS